MNSPDQASVLRARLQLMLEHPYLASAIARLPLVENDRWCKTMATDGYYIYVNMDFARSLQGYELKAVLAHELLHCILGHIDRRGQRDRSLWNVAIDLATNLMLTDFGFQLPNDGLLDPTLRGLTAEQIFERLANNSALRTKYSEMRAALEVGATSTGSGSLIDQHVEDGDPSGSDQRRAHFPTEIERTRLRRELSSNLIKNMPGLTAGLMETEVRAAQSTVVPWQKLLAEFFTGLRRNDFRWLPPSKRYLWRGIYLPSIGQPGPRHIVIAIDTSGSITQAMLEVIVGELDALRGMSECVMTIVQFDASIQGWCSYDPWELAALDFRAFNVRGRGGTDFRPVFDWLRKQHEVIEEPVDSLFLMSDGFGIFPKMGPDVPCVWIMPAESHAAVPFGIVIEIPMSTMVGQG